MITAQLSVRAHIHKHTTYLCLIISKLFVNTILSLKKKEKGYKLLKTHRLYINGRNLPLECTRTTHLQMSAVYRGL